MNRYNDLMADEVLGVDLGATKIAAGLVSRDGEINRLKICTTKAEEGKEAVIVRLIELINGYPLERISVIGLGAPGPIDKNCTTLINPPNLAGWRNVPLPKIISEKTGYQVAFDKDANCALLGERWIGIAKNYQNVVLLTLGTGIGGAILQNGEVLPAPEQLEDEVGHLIVKSDSGRADQAGHHGCAEALIGSWSIERQTGHNLKYWMTDKRKNQLEAQKIINQWYQNLSVFINKIKDIYRPELVVLAGGVARSVDLRRLKESAQKIAISSLEQPVILGAAKKALDLLGVK